MSSLELNGVSTKYIDKNIFRSNEYISLPRTIVELKAMQIQTR